MPSAAWIEAAQRPRNRVLVVDDNLDAVHSMAVLMKMMGHECRFAINGLGALFMARVFSPDTVFLDIGLPDVSGLDIARQLKWESGVESTKIIAVTALPDVDRVRALDAGCDDFYRKPLDPKDLEQLLAKRRNLTSPAAEQALRSF